MLRRIQLVAFAIGTGLFILTAPGNAFADYGNVICEENDPYCDITVGDDGDSGDGDSGGGGDGDDVNPNPGPGGGEVVDCTVEPGEEPLDACLPNPQFATIVGLAETARDRLVLPVPEIAASPSERQLVHLPTWLVVSESSWRTVSASVSAGSVTVTATAAPSRVEWHLGNGAVVVCEGPGTAWRPGMDPRAESPDCGYTYTRSAPQVEVAATVYWTVTWSSTTGSGGSFTDLATTSQVVWEVAEARSVIVR